MILHHIQTSPNGDNGLKTCLRYIAANDTILLSSDGIIALLQQQWINALAPFKVMLLKEDVIARGLAPHFNHYSQIDFNEFILQTIEHEKVITW